MTNARLAGAPQKFGCFMEKTLSQWLCAHCCGYPSVCWSLLGVRGLRCLLCFPGLSVCRRFERSPPGAILKRVTIWQSFSPCWVPNRRPKLASCRPFLRSFWSRRFRNGAFRLVGAPAQPYRPKWGCWRQWRDSRTTGALSARKQLTWKSSSHEPS